MGGPLSEFDERAMTGDGRLIIEEYAI